MEIWEVDDGGKTRVEGLLADGRPDPAYAAALGLVPAPLGRRAGAFALECAVYVVLQLPMWIFMLPLLLKFLTGRIGAYGFVNHPDFRLAAIMAGVSAAFTLLFLLVQLTLHGSKGMTLGKAVTGLRSVNVRTLEKPGIGRVFLRALLVWSAGLLPFGSILVLASPLFDKSGRHRGWHDRVGHLWMVDVREGLNPYDEKRMRVARKTLAATPRAEREQLPSLTSAPGAGVYQPGARLSAGVIGRSGADSSPSDQGAGAPVGGALATPMAGPPEPPAPAMPAPAAPAPPRSAPLPSAPPPAPASAPVDPTRVRPATAGAAPPGFVLHLDAGELITIESPVVLGRNPKSPTGAQARPVVIADEQLSRTHLLVRPVDGGLELTDLGSSNGTTVSHDGVERPLVAHQPSVVVAADLIQIGQRTATVRRA